MGIYALDCGCVWFSGGGPGGHIVKIAPWCKVHRPKQEPQK